MYNAKSAAASLRGRQNRAEGEAFENLIINSCEYYRGKGIAVIDKTPEPFRVTRSLNKGQFQGHFTSQAQPDFKGAVLVMLPGHCDFYGRCIVFDAKATTTDRIPITALTETQRKDLLAYQRCGAVAGVLMCFNFQKFAWLEIDTFLTAKQVNGHQYWTHEEAIAWGEDIKYKGNRLILFNEGE